MPQWTVPGTALMAALVTVMVAAPAAFGADEATILARRGTAALSSAEMATRLAEIPVDKRPGFLADPERIDQIVSQLLLIEQLADEARASGLDRDPRYPGLRDLADKRILSQLRLEQLRSEAASGFDATALARERYLAEPSRFVIAESRTARHILFDTEKRSNDEALEAAQAAAKRLDAGEDFAALVRELSDDTGTQGDGGLLRDVVRGQTDPGFEVALFALDKAGTRTQPIKSRFGWHLIELVSVTPERKQAFDEVRATLEAETAAQQVERVVRSHTDQLQGLPVEADLEALQTLRTPRPIPSAPTSD